MPGRSLDGNDGLSKADYEAGEAAHKAGCELRTSQPRSPGAEAVPGGEAGAAGSSDPRVQPAGRRGGASANAETAEEAGAGR